MEYNKDEAGRAKEIAEKKFMAQDLSGAKKFAVKAQQLYPSLEGLPQMMAVLDVHLAAEKKINGQTDWYGILQVDLVADEALIKKQYRKLALMLHPDKNKAVGAEGAFKLLGEAWGVLSDKVKRSVYDHKRNMSPFQQHQKIQKPPNAASNANNGHYRHPPPAAPPPQPNMGTGGSIPATTFWTSCPFCKMQYEYPRLYVNHHLLCPTCQKPFMAFEIKPFSRTGANAAAQKPTGAAAAAAFFHTPSGASFPGMSRGVPYPNANSFAQNAFAKGSNSTANAANDVKAKAEPVKKKEDTPKKNQPKSEKARTADGRGNGTKAATSEKKKKRRRKAKEDSDSDDDVKEVDYDEDEFEDLKVKGKGSSDSKGQDVEAENKRSTKKPKDATESSTSKKSQKSDTGDTEDEESVQDINVPDADFHDFDKDRTENLFDADQVWAIYDDDDGMPRFYARIKNVISGSKFKVKMIWLEAITNEEKTVASWLDDGFYQGCGKFKQGKSASNDVLNIFSHVVAWEKGPKGSIRIVPQKGDVWALYKEWSSTWDEDTPSEIKHKYEMVEIVNDFAEETGVNVAPLVRVYGFKSVYQKKQVDQFIPRKELLRFSHQVPAKRLLGEEAPNLPQNCWELDPAATPEDECKAT